MPGISISLNTMAVLCLFLRKINKHHHQHERLNICLTLLVTRITLKKQRENGGMSFTFPLPPHTAFYQVLQ